MIMNDLLECIDAWSSWASDSTVERYDIALFKIWIQFERFIGDIFVIYATGQSSEAGYTPELKIRFKDEEQLNAFLRENNKKYIEYPVKIEKLSKHIFAENPFDTIFIDVNNRRAFDQMKYLRNYVAHESGEAKAKLINACFNGNSNQFKEPNEFLLSREPITRNSFYTYYIDKIKDIANLLINPVF